MADRRQMHANLVCTAGCKLSRDKTMGAITRIDLNARQRASAIIDHALPQSIVRIAADWGIDLSAAGQHTLDDGLVASRHFVALQRRGEHTQCPTRRCYDQQTARILV